MNLPECERCGALKMYGRCMDCYPALPTPIGPLLPYSDLELVRRPTRVDVRPIEALRHVGELAPFNTRWSMRKAGDIVATLALIDSATAIATAWAGNPHRGTGVYIRQQSSVQGLIFRRSASDELLVRELF